MSDIKSGYGKLNIDGEIVDVYIKEIRERDANVESYTIRDGSGVEKVHYIVGEIVVSRVKPVTKVVLIDKRRKMQRFRDKYLSNKTDYYKKSRGEEK